MIPIQQTDFTKHKKTSTKLVEVFLFKIRF